MYLYFDPEVRALLASIEIARPDQIVTDRFPTVVIVGGGFGGYVEIAGIPEKGTTVVVSMPIGGPTHENSDR